MASGAPAGLRIALEAITPEHEQRLIDLTEESGLAYPPYDPGNTRSSTSYGWKFDYRTENFVPCPPLPSGLEQVAAIAAELAGLTAADFAECLLNRYEPGAVIQPHFDKPVWEHVVGVSLGSETEMLFSQPGEGSADTPAPIAVPLPRRSIYVLAGDARHVYQHALPPMTSTRWSITFRSFSDEGLRRLHESAEAI